MSKNIDQLNIVRDEAEDSDEGFADCPEGAHEGCGGPWWHELSLEERALQACDGGGPWWAEAAAEILGQPVFSLPDRCPDESCTTPVLEGVTYALEEVEFDIAEVVESIRCHQKGCCWPNAGDVARNIYELIPALEHLAGFLDQLVTLTFPNKAE
jgi:hypothetical protein